MAESIAKEEEEGRRGGGDIGEDDKSAVAASLSRKEKRKDRKKLKRKQVRKEMAQKEREEEEARLNDPEEQRRAKEMEEEERERMERVKKEFEERERKWLEEMEKKRKQEEEEEEERRRALEEEEEAKRLQMEKENEGHGDDDWEYVEEGPAEIIWQGNEIIVRKKRVKVPKKNADEKGRNEVSDRPTSNPLPPQSEAFANYQNASMASAEELLENVAQQVPNFGTEQDKAHCPFHLKTGACRFGQRCSRVHFYPDKACTLLMKNMYNGPGLAWEQDEGLEYTDEEVDHCYEEFYEDVHTEFLKYGEIVNFKVCKNSSFHLRGNVYVQYKSLDSAVFAYHSLNGRYFAGKQVQCEFVNVTRWKVAICGEYMKSRLKTCSRGNSCNFIHCFRNPGGDYEWADWDKPPPRYWVKKMAALFGDTDEYYEKHMEQETKKIGADTERRHSRRSISSDRDHLPPGKSCGIEYDCREGTRSRLHRDVNRKGIRTFDVKSYEKDDHHSEPRSHDSNSDGGLSDRDFHAGTERNKHHACVRSRSKHHDKVSEQSTDLSVRKINDRTDEADSNEWSDENSGRTLRTQGGSSEHWKKCTSPDDNSVRKDKFLVEGGYNFHRDRDRDRDREKHHPRARRTSRHQSKVRSTNDLGDGKESNRDKERHSDHPRRKSSRTQHSFLDDRYKAGDTDSSDEWIDRDEERYQRHKRRRSRHSDQEVSDDEGISEKRSRKNYHNEETEMDKSHLKGEATGGHFIKRSRSSRKSLKTKEKHGSCVDHQSNHKSIEEFSEQDRWKPESSDSDQNCAGKSTSIERYESASPP